MLPVLTSSSSCKLGHTLYYSPPLPPTSVDWQPDWVILGPSNSLWAAAHWVKVPSRTHKHNSGPPKPPMSPARVLSPVHTDLRWCLSQWLPLTVSQLSHPSSIQQEIKPLPQGC